MSESGKPNTPQHKTQQPGSLPAHEHVQLQPESILLDRYQVIGLLGAGGMGSVFHVKHLHLQSEFALKVLNRQADATLWRRFENEARAASRLDHPNLIKVYDSGLLPDGQPFFVMEYIKGQTLADLIAKHGRLPVRKTLKIFIQVGFALAYAHENGVIHRDLKPSNIMLTRGLDGSLTSAVKVVDLGIAKLTGADEFNQQTLTRTGEIFGSPLYMSPEQCLGGPVDSKADLYSFGCSMYEALTGAPPFIGENALSTMMKHQLDAPLSLKEASMGIEFPPEVEKLVTRLLEKSPLSRYPSAQLLTAEIAKIEQELGESESPEAVATKTSISSKANTFDIRSFFGKHIFTVLLIVVAYCLGIASNVLKHSEHQQPNAKIPESIGVSALFPNGNYKRPGSSPIESETQSYFSELSADGKTRLFRFPEKSIGEILVDETVRLARGNMSFPADKLIAFRPAAFYLDSTSLLKRFRPDELGVLELRDEVRTSIDVLKILPRFKRLRKLRIAMDVDDTALSYIDQLPNLEDLDVSNTGMTGEGISRLKRFPHLVMLDCSGIEQPEPLFKKLSQTKLKRLGLESLGLKENDLREIGKIKTLEDLNISGNQDLDDKSMIDIKDLPNLRFLYIATTSITAKSFPILKQYKKLEDLFISKNMFSADEIKELKRISKTSIEFRGETPASYKSWSIDQKSSN